MNDVVFHQAACLGKDQAILARLLLRSMGKLGIHRNAQTSPFKGFTMFQLWVMMHNILKPLKHPRIASRISTTDGPSPG